MQGVLYIITFICIVYGIYKMVIDDQSGLAAASFIFGVLTFLITLVPTETPTNAGGMQNPVNTEIQKEWESEIKETETETDEKGDSVEEDISGNDIVANNGNSSTVNTSGLIKIEGDQISGDISNEDECHSYEYIPSVSGIYRFDFTSSDNTGNYIFIIKTNNNEKKAHTYYTNKGVTVSLDKDEKYKIIIQQYKGYLSYVVNIGVPKDVQGISDISFGGSLTYTDQCDRYIYTASVTGKYRFDFSTDNTQSNFCFKMYASDKSEKAYTYYSNEGATVYLMQGEQYAIYVEQHSKFSNYSIRIGIPNEIQEISNISFWGSLSYTDQRDIYTYIAPITGKYRFDFSADNTQSNYCFKMYASDKSEKAYTYYSNGGTTVNLTQGEQYTIYVEQHSGFLNYSIDIGIPNEIQEIGSNSFSGSLIYIDQTDRYTYRAPITGTYRFDFFSDNTQSNYCFRMYASDKSEKAYTYYSNGGVTVSLKEGEIYTINVIQHSKTGNYTINIGVPNAVVETSENNISGNMLYIDQADTYLYKASITGVHVFSFETNDVESNYEVVVISSTNEKLMQTYYSNKTKKVELEAGQEYIIKVVQYIGFPMYTINISME